MTSPIATPATRLLDRHAGVHKAQDAAADRCHRRRTVRLGDVRDDTNRVRKIGFVRKNGFDSPASKISVPDLATRRAAETAGFTDRIWREIVMEHESGV